MVGFAPAIDAALGRSIISEELKGDYALARERAEEQLREARGTGDPGPVADALLARGVVSILQGEPAAARDVLAEGGRLVPDDPARLLRFAAYANLATKQNYAAFPDGTGGGSELDAYWDGVADANENGPRREALAGRVADPAVRLEAVLVEELLVLGRVGLGIVDHQRNQGERTAARLLDTALSAPRAFARQAAAAGAGPGALAAADLTAARLCRRAHDLPQATEFLDRAADGYRRAGDPAGEAACEMTRGDWLAAPVSTPAAWNFLLKEGVVDSDLGWAAESGEFDGAAGDRDEARRAYDRAARLFEAAGAPRGRAALRLRAGYLAAVGGDFAAAADHAGGAADAFAAAGDHLGGWTARCHAALGRVGQGRFVEDPVAGAVGEWGRAGGSFSFALGLGLMFTRAGRRWLAARGDFERALACHRLAGAVFDALGAAAAAAQSLADEGDVYRAVGEPTAAGLALERARDRHVTAAAAAPRLPGLSLLRAADLAAKAYLICEAGRDAAGMARNLTRLEELADRPPPADGDGHQTALWLGAVQRLRMQAANARAQVPRWLGKKAQEDGDEAEAGRRFGEALAACKADPYHGDVMEAAVLADQRRYPEAVAAFRRHLAGRSGGLVGRLTAMLGSAFGPQGQAVARGQDQNTLKHAAVFFTKVREYREAKGYFDRLEAVAGPDWWRGGQDSWQYLLDYAETYEGLGDGPAALGYYDRALALLDEQRRSLGRDELKTALLRGSSAQLAHFGATRVALRLREEAGRAGRADEARAYAARAFDYAERGKARALLDLMAGGAAAGGAADGSPAADWRRLTARLTVWRGLLARAADRPDPDRDADLRARVAADEAELRQVEAGLARDDPDFYHAINPSAGVLALDRVCAALPPGTALLQYYFLGDDLLAWAVTDQGMVQAHARAADARAVARQIRAFHRSCAEGGSPDGLSGPLADLLLAPLADTIRANRRLVVVPFGAAHLLPFHALPWEGRRPLADTHTVSYLPSASVLQFLRPGRPRPDRVLAVGDPAGMSVRPPLGGPPAEARPLPWAGTEARHVAGLFPGGAALVGAEATKAAVSARLADFPVLHFATHGHLSAEAPLLSALLLAGGEALTVAELMGRRLTADLVVLSACDTGRGEATGGDEVLGLTRGVLGAGARAAVVSLWEVGDYSTSLLMGAFYARLRAGDDPAEALRAAQAHLRGLTPDRAEKERAGLPGRHVGGAARRGVGTDYRHPFHWAPFVAVVCPPRTTLDRRSPA